MKLPTCLLLLLGTVPCLAQMPAEIVTAERSKILQGVTSVPKQGTPGPIAIWGTMAFPILSAPDKDGVELAVVAAAAYAKGRIILFGQNGYLSGTTGGDNAKLIENCVKWAGAKDKPRVGLKGVKPEAYEKLGFRTETFEKVDAKTLNDFDVVVMNIQSITGTEEGAAVAEFIKKGGGVMAGMTGWAFSQTSGGKELTLAHGVNNALMPAGVAFTEASAFDQLRSFDARPELPLMMNASTAITAIKKQREGGPALDAAAIKQGTNAIQVALAAQPPDRSSLREAVVAALGNTGASSAVPTGQAPLTAAKDNAARLRLGMETRVLRLAGGETTTAHPAHEAFPGKVPADAPRITREVSVNPTIPGWTSTGLYAAAGETISVTVPTAIAAQGYAVRIGCHSDTLYHLDEWKRAPDITKSVTIAATETKTASAFGGLIYIVVPGRADETASFTATIKGGIPSPLFVLGQTTDAQWTSEIKKQPGPWAELACDKLIVSCPTEVARTINNPTELMEFWKKVVEAQDDLSNQTAERKRPERIVADIQISAGYMHSGYPIMIPTSAAPEMVTFGRIKFPGWGFYHEIGHNHQRSTFTFDGTGEVTNNVIGMYCYEAVLKKDKIVGHSGASLEGQKKHIEEIKAAKDKFAEWKKSPFLALTTYIQLVDAFGWEAWRKYLHSFADDKYGPAPKDDDDARDQFLIRYSKITGKNLAPFLEFWGLPFSANAKAEVSKLEAWMPKGI
ncbi:M60 family metallopeptidase [Brevifollis gellanilyticus]|uniref:Peptidase M60 domain-containing protein n=1 Tax=Brevifollis gellanilyticus TaxID=748831 RepID=A0A512M4S3_9BACT|nr:M60 family metallopeptidase [Brevifollis gellanilyticus]GEP41745.1 hypothetical protein BGE01nite_10360 [Brevifollis gellanilyticus]